MVNKNELIADQVLKNIGGKSNVTNAWHCVTRLRFNLQDKNLVNIDTIKQIKGVMGAQFAGDQFQVIIGNTVDDVFEAVEKKLGGAANRSDDQQTGVAKEGIISKLMDVISGIFTPILPALAGTGLIKGILALVDALGWLSDKSGLYQAIFMISDCVFYFLPFFVAVSAAKKFKTSEYLALCIAGIMLYPTMITGVANIAKGGPAFIKLFGLLAIPFISYTSSVIPIILATWFLAYVLKWVKKWIPSTLTMMFTPMVTLFIVVPVTLIVLGPLGTYAGNIVADGISWLFVHAGPLAGVVLGASFPLIVMTGMHYAFVPIVMNNFSVTGYDTTVMPINFVTNMAQAGSVFGVAVRTKNKATKQLAISAGISALLGVTEPAMYGINLKFKKPFYAALISGGIAGGISGFFVVKAFAMTGLTGLTALPAFISQTHPMNLIYLVLAIGLSFVLAFVLTIVFGISESIEESAEPVGKVQVNNEKAIEHSIYAPVKGEVELLANVNDPTFAQEIMGKGIAIVPESDEIVAPISGKIMILPDSKHAIGILGDDGTELLIHIGIDTVELKGQYFTPKIVVNEHVEVGQPIMSVDFEQIKKAGYDPTVMVIITNTTSFLDVLPMNETGIIFPKEQLLVGIK
ncbi:beta-glucoside-specific PTS transporter subunit IIABC [Latilactobacillus graminis]|uniref:PTS system sucrose-specific EIIBCA component n=2 Tax=Latilactobacillus graminis TaxID=60519 RepID=A0AA89I2X8_9LACO|nr:beta-glucoside-specific PTS transporter subunit IIABC [Latilactobacillus graminis]KRM24533.1 PTS system beta-glucoside-specific EIIBCA component [Latilactobacillus graminis DSM 20719]QFP79013.1 PTS beta-glucoside transporter subunit EIIBCA [Latilactobacillus graminis]